MGVVDFDSAMHLQQRLVYEVAGCNDQSGGILVCEHPPIVTIGREGSSAHVGASATELRSQQLQIRWTNRGGGAIVHCPGQLAVYPILPLDRLGFSVTDYRQLLEDSVLDVCREIRIPAWRRTDRAGVFCRLGRIAIVGAAVKSWVSYHGVFVNVCPSMLTQRIVHPEHPDIRLTSIAAQQMRQTSMHSIRERLVRNLAERLGYAEYRLFTGHPLLKRYRAPSG